MAKKTKPKVASEKRAAILKELESVRSMLDEEKHSLKQLQENVETEDNEFLIDDEAEDESGEFQIPLLDPAKPTTYELDFSKPVQKPQQAPSPQSKVQQEQVEPDPESIPTIDDISASSSLFDDEDETPQSPKVTQAEVKEHAQLLLQDMLNDAISEIEEKLDEWIPRLEIKLQKRLEKAIDKYIQDALNK